MTIDKGKLFGRNMGRHLGRHEHKEMRRILRLEPYSKRGIHAPCCRQTPQTCGTTPAPPRALPCVLTSFLFCFLRMWGPQCCFGVVLRIGVSFGI